MEEKKAEGSLGAAPGFVNKTRRGQGNASNSKSVSRIAINNHIL